MCIGIATTLIQGRVGRIVSLRHQVHVMVSPSLFVLKNIGHHFVIGGVRRECDWVAVHSGGGACPLMFWMLHSTLHWPRSRMKEINFSLDEFDSKTVR